MARKKTIGQAVQEIQSLEGRVAVLMAAVSYFRVRYVGRDSALPIARLKRPDGSPVPETAVEEICDMWDDEIRAMESSIKAYRGTALNG